MTVAPSGSHSPRDKPINLSNVEEFRSHWSVSQLIERYKRDAILAKHALGRLVEDLEYINQQYLSEFRRVAFTTIEVRVKDEDSFFRKLYKLCYSWSEKKGLNQNVVKSLYPKIRDLAGARFSCPYYDEIEPAVNAVLRPALRNSGYGTALQKDSALRDRNHLDKGDENGYRAYHFFVKVPTCVDIYGKTTLVLCEIQARTELQHSWAVKSHNLLYKPEKGWDFDENVRQDMHQVSNHLRVADQFLLSVRDRVTRPRK